ncbi:TonB-dependent receptor family protein [Kushneria sp. Sum13]|uniref:TonB-dependent receptor family protein n=1 Tax=Kushneria sp. Sum13 TaxID=3459196 RepID=UPI004045750D
MTSRRTLLLALAGAMTAGSAHGEEIETTEAVETMVISAPRLARELYDTPAAVSTVERDSIQRGQQRVRLDESLGQVPGVFIQNRDNFAQGQRIAIRGFGARAPFGVRGITILMDGIPYTLPDGQAQIDAIDLDSAESIEVIRGPASVLYGNAAGGVISVTTADGREDPGTRLRVEGGSDGYKKASLQTGGSDGDWSHHVSLSALNQDGYRDHSSVEKYLLNAKLRRELSEDRALTAIVNLLDNPRSEDPGGLTREQVGENRRGTANSNFYSPTRIDSGQEVDQQVVGLQYEDLSAGPGELYVKGFYSWRNFEQQLPYVGDDNLLGYDRDYYGASAEYHDSVHLSEMPLRYAAGIEVARQEDDRYRYGSDVDGNRSAKSEDETQTATSTGFFVQGDLDLTDQWTASLGARYDRVRLKIDDDFNDSGDDSGDREFNEWSGSAGLSYRYLPTHQAYVNTGTSFETPTFSEFANPAGGGGFNASVEPQKAWNREVGLRGHFNNGLNYDVALFSVRVRDELVPYTVDGRDFYQNAGDTDRDGLEVALGWQFLDAWRLDSALTLAHYRFDSFEDNEGERHDSNRIPGLPEQTWVNWLTWEGTDQRFATLETQYIGDMVADNANDVDVDSYWLINLRAGEGWQLGNDTSLNLYAGIRNLFDREHFANTRINASNDRYFEPAPGRTFYAGVEFGF